MPELRSQARRNRAVNNPNPNHNPIKLTVQTHQRRRTAQNNNKRKEDAIASVDDKQIFLNPETTPLKKDDEKEPKVLREVVAEKKMDEYDSGGRSADKGPGAEDEGSTAPLPEKVSVFSEISFLFGLRESLGK